MKYKIINVDDKLFDGYRNARAKWLVYYTPEGDKFDKYSHHIVAVNEENNEVVGGMRIVPPIANIDNLLPVELFWNADLSSITKNVDWSNLSYCEVGGVFFHEEYRNNLHTILMYEFMLVEAINKDFEVVVSVSWDDFLDHIQLAFNKTDWLIDSTQYIGEQRVGCYLDNGPSTVLVFDSRKTRENISILIDALKKKSHQY